MSRGSARDAEERAFPSASALAGAPLPSPARRAHTWNAGGPEPRRSGKSAAASRGLRDQVREQCLAPSQLPPRGFPPPQAVPRLGVRGEHSGKVPSSLPRAGDWTRLNPVAWQLLPPGALAEGVPRCGRPGLLPGVRGMESWEAMLSDLCAGWAPGARACPDEGCRPGGWGPALSGAVPSSQGPLQLTAAGGGAHGDPRNQGWEEPPGMATPSQAAAHPGRLSAWSRSPLLPKVRANTPGLGPQPGHSRKPRRRKG